MFGLSTVDCLGLDFSHLEDTAVTFAVDNEPALMQQFLAGGKAILRSYLRFCFARQDSQQSTRTAMLPARRHMTKLHGRAAKP